MISFLSGMIAAKKPQFIILETNGIGFKVIVSSKTLHKLPGTGSKLKVFCYTNIKQDGIDIYGFLDEEDLEIFELFNSISGIGPKIALKILNTTKTKELLSAISLGRHDILTKVSGVGKKTAHRLILELRDKIKNKADEGVFSSVEENDNLEIALKNLGYKKTEIKESINSIPTKMKSFEEKIKIALKFLAKK
ncbi:MAG: Holliday junction branch migration protein RuvA [Patescibacteria group bacterium]